MRQGRAQALIAGLTVIGVVAAFTLSHQRKRRQPRRVYDYSDRSGFPRPAAQMRGAWQERKQQAKKERASSPLSGEARTSP